MDLMEVRERERVRREDVACRRHALADGLTRNNEIELRPRGRRVKVHVPDEFDFTMGDRDRDRDRGRGARTRGRTEVVTRAHAIRN